MKLPGMSGLRGVSGGIFGKAADKGEIFGKAVSEGDVAVEAEVVTDDSEREGSLFHEAAGSLPGCLVYPVDTMVPYYSCLNSFELVFFGVVERPHQFSETSEQRPPILDIDPW